MDAIKKLNALEETEDPAVVVYLLGDALNKFESAESVGGTEFIEVWNC